MFVLFLLFFMLLPCRNISGLGVGGWLGPELLKLHSLKELDVSFNNIAGEIPPTLPPNVEYLYILLVLFAYPL